MTDYCPNNRSPCRCGHDLDDHRRTTDGGNGSCASAGCDCQQFTELDPHDFEPWPEGDGGFLHNQEHVHPCDYACGGRELTAAEAAELGLIPAPIAKP